MTQLVVIIKCFSRARHAVTCSVDKAKRRFDKHMRVIDSGFVPNGSVYKLVVQEGELPSPKLFNAELISFKLYLIDQGRI